MRFRRKERGTRVKDREKSGASKRAGRGWGRKEGYLHSPPPPPSFTFWLSFHFSRGQNRKSPSSVFLCSETKRKRLLRRLLVYVYTFSTLIYFLSKSTPFPPKNNRMKCETCVVISIEQPYEECNPSPPERIMEF